MNIKSVKLWGCHAFTIVCTILEMLMLDFLMQYFPRGVNNDLIIKMFFLGSVLAFLYLNLTFGGLWRSRLGLITIFLCGLLSILTAGLYLLIRL